MQLLIDANLSPKLVARISAKFPNTLHVFSTTLPPDAPDVDIWVYARENGLSLIFTYDEDFRNLAERFGPPPKVILVRTYDQRTAAVARLLLRSEKAIINFLTDDDAEIIELRG